MPLAPIIRLIKPDDSISELTELLHRAYGALAERGMYFTASHQDETVTRSRIEGIECYVAVLDGRMVGTVAFRDAASTEGTPWYDRPDVASFGQFAVEPELQGKGIGSQFLALMERRAKATGAYHLALDTAEPAQDLIQFYGSRGFRFIEYAQWDSVNYRSVILSKWVAAVALPEAPSET